MSAAKVAENTTVCNPAIRDNEWDPLKTMAASPQLLATKEGWKLGRGKVGIR